jgi:hypothetical protein
LESCRAVGEAKEHDEQLKQASVSLESGLPLITFLHVDIVETPVGNSTGWGILCRLRVWVSPGMGTGKDF